MNLKAVFYSKSYQTNKIFTLVILISFLPILTNAQHTIQVNNFYKPQENPILKADSSFTFFCPIKKEWVRWQAADVFNPAAIVKDNKVFLLYRCEDNRNAILGKRTSRLGLAESSDGIHFTKYPTPVLYPTNDAFQKYDSPGGCEDPRLAQTEDGKYVVIYTSWNYDTPRLSVAFSKDLIHWEKKGPAFAKAGKLLAQATKSGSIITKFKNGKQVIAKINGKYWMYWGENFVNLAWSKNLYDWYPTLDKNGDLAAVIRTRPHYFDSSLTECGPPAVLTDKGIVLFYNGKNAEDENAASTLAKGTYSVGQVIFDAKNPSKVVERSEVPFLQPSLPHEKSGQYKAGTTFSEGLIFFKGQWLLYYGTADSFVGLAISPQ